jgi:hypothetical protein
MTKNLVYHLFAIDVVRYEVDGRYYLVLITHWPFGNHLFVLGGHHVLNGRLSDLFFLVLWALYDPVFGLGVVDQLLSLVEKLGGVTVFA